MKKIVTLLLVLAMSFSLVACGTKNASPKNEEVVDYDANDEASAEQESSVPADVPTGMKVGFVYSPESDALSRTYRTSLRYITEAFGCEVLFTDMLDSSTEAMIGYYENLIQQGAEGLIMLTPPSVAFLAELESKKIYYTFIDTGDPDIQEFVKTAEYYCGKLVSRESDDPERGLSYDVTRSMLDCLYDVGCRNLVYVGIAAGNDDHDRRYKAWTEFQAEKDDVTAVAEYRGADVASGISDILASYGSEIDGICVSDSSCAAVSAAIISAGLQNEIIISSFDMSDVIPDLMKANMVAGVGGGNTAFFELCFVMMYNKWAGADDVLSVDENKRIPIPDIFVIKDAEQYAKYEKYFTGDLPAFTADELKQLCSFYYPDTTVQEKNDYLWWLADPENYNLDVIAERHAELID